MLLVFSGRGSGLLATHTGPWRLALVCFNFQGAYYTDISLPFGLHYAAVHCQDVTSVITRELNKKGTAILTYINDFGVIATDQTTAATHFNNLRTLLARMGLQEVAHKAPLPLPPQVMVWLGLQFDAVTTTVSLPQDKLSEIQLI